MHQTKTMTTGKPMGLLVVFALPLMLGNIFQQLYTVVDTAIVGRGVGMDALAALGAVDWLYWLFLGLAIGFTQGFSIRIAQKYGEGDLPGLKSFVGQAAVLSVLISLVCTLLFQTMLPLFFLLLRIPEEIRHLSELYIRFLMGGFPLVVFYNYTAAVLRAVGNSKTPLLAMIVAAVLNIVLDCLTVFVLGWGIAGAAAATVFSQAVSGLICLLQIFKTPELRFGKQHLRLTRDCALPLMKLGAPIAAKNALVSVGGMTIQSVVNGFGLSFIAGVTATNKLYGLLETAALSYSYAVTTYVGQNYGAWKPERIKRGMGAATVLSLITSVIIAAVMIVFGRPITLLFISAEDPALVTAAGDTAYLYLLYMSVSLPVMYIMYIFQAAMQGLGNTVVPMVSGLIQLCFRVVIALISAYFVYEKGVFLAEVAAWYATLAYLLVIVLRTMKRLAGKI